MVILLLFGLAGCPSGGGTGGTANFGAVKDFGKACVSGSQCESKRCEELDGIFACTRYCYSASDCNEGYYCAWEPQEAPQEEPPEGEEPKERGVCRSMDEREICSTCSNDGMCDSIGGYCKTVGQGRSCIISCKLADCPNGFTCMDDNDGNAYCYPDTDDCSCNMLREGAIRSCSLSNEYGECPGTITCQGDSGWTACMGEMPGPESCDGIDNNCDGQVDEGILGTVEHCSSCNDVCLGSGLPGTTAVCIEGSCGLDCFENYYDANDNSQDGCECDDDTLGVHRLEDVVSAGSFTDCDGTHMLLTNSLIPSGTNGEGPPDYYSFNYRNVWNCQENLDVRLKIYSQSAPHRFCVSGANESNESNWTCHDVQPGDEVTISPYDGEGTYYIKVGLTGSGELNCMPYELRVVES